MNVNYLKRYIISSYVLVWALIIFVAAPASLVLRFHLLSCGLYEISSHGLHHTCFYLDGSISGLMRKEQLSLSGVSLLKCRYSHFYLHLVLHLGSVFYHSSSTHL